MTRSKVQRYFVSILLAAAFIRLLTAWLNVGFVAIDDYVYMLKLAFPAQNLPSFGTILQRTWVHPPLPMLLLSIAGQIPLHLGFTDPLRQIQFTYSLMGLWSLFSIYFAGKIFFELERPREGLVAAFLIGLHGLMPFFSTRVLFETFSMPLLTGSLYFFMRFVRHSKNRDLFFSIVFITVASLVRYQSGVCFLAMAGYLIFAKSMRRHLPVFCLYAAGLFVTSGLIDVALGRSFQQSVIDYIRYNLHHSGDYGVSKPWNFVLFFLGFSLPPFLLRHWRGFLWKERYSSLSPALTFFLVFLVSHSLIPHKEDRFMIPILPVFLLLLAPLVNRLIEEGARKRLIIFGGLNFVILILTSCFTAQWNTIGVARFLHNHRSYNRLVNFNDSLVFMPSSYMNRPDLKIVQSAASSTRGSSDCGTLTAVREDRLQAFRSAAGGNEKEIAVSKPGPLEWLIVKANPKHNGRRAAIHLFAAAGCFAASD